MSPIDRIALLVCLLAFAASAYVADRVYERVPHIEDEMAFIWQARVIAAGRLTAPTPQPNPDSFKVPFVVDYQGQRFGKYPIGWPVVLSFGELAQARHLVNPLLTGAAVWLLYLLAKKLVSEPAALLAIVLMAASPFVLINGGALNSHPLALLLALAFTIAWLDAFTQPNPRLPARLARWLPAVTAAFALGLLALTRPWTALAVAAPFFAHGLWLLARGSSATRLRLVATGALAVLVASLTFLWQYAVTGDALLNPYTLWWPYDRVGFGPSYGLAEEGHTLALGLLHTSYSLYRGSSDLLGWPNLSWIFLPFGLWALRRDARAWLITAVLASLVAAYTAYWTPAWVYGPRYYYEALFAPILLTAAGVAWLSGLPAAMRDWRWSPGGKLRPALTLGLVVVLVASNLINYLPMRMETMTRLHGITADCARPLFTGLQPVSDPALVFVHVQRFFDYACLIDHNDPFLTAPVIIAISRDPEIDAAVAQAFSDRIVRHYYPDTRRLHENRREIPPATIIPPDDRIDGGN